MVSTLKSILNLDSEQMHTLNLKLSLKIEIKGNFIMWQFSQYAHKINSY